MKKQHYTKEEFMELAGKGKKPITKSRLSQLMNGYKHSDGYMVPPVLIEGKDYKRAGVIFFQSAIKKIVRRDKK